MDVARTLVGELEEVAEEDILRQTVQEGRSRPGCRRGPHSSVRRRRRRRNKEEEKEEVIVEVVGAKNIKSPTDKIFQVSVFACACLQGWSSVRDYCAAVENGVCSVLML